MTPTDRAVVARWKARLAIRRALETAARKRHVWKPTAATRATLDKRKRQVAAADRVIERHSHPATIPARDRHVSGHGLDFIAGYEGFVDHVYRDAVGIPTIGYGHVVKPGEHFPNRIAHAGALALLRRDANLAEVAVRDAVKVPLTQNEYDALVSFAYNVGGGALRSSTLVRKLNEGHDREAADEFLKWTKAGGRVLPGLLRRRNEERALFMR